jgi:hypothetical protein
MSTRTAPFTCVCGYAFDAATHAGKGEPEPKPGDFTLCLKCARPYVFGEWLTLLPCILSDLSAEVRAKLEMAQRVLRDFHRQRPS